MQPRELPNLTVGNRPTMGPDAGSSLSQRGFKWLVACSLGLLVAAGVTFSLVAQPTENTVKPKAAATQAKPLVKPAMSEKPGQPPAPIITDLPE